MKTLGIQIRVGDLLFVIQKRWKLIVSLTFLGFVFGLLMSGLSYIQSSVQSYQITGSFAIAAIDDRGIYASNGVAPNKNDFTLAADLYDTVYYFMRSDRLLYDVIDKMQLLGVSPSDIRNGLSISRYNETSIITMRLVWNSGEEGLALWDTLISSTNSLLRQIMDMGRLRIINEPVSAAYGSQNSAAKSFMILPVLGLAAGIGISVIELLMRPTLINLKDVETVFGLETLGVIPYDYEFFNSKTSILVRDDTTFSQVVQNFSAAAYILRNRIGSKEKHHCLYVTSAISREGRTAVAANIAIQLSDMEHRTLLVDFDYRNPTLGTLFLNSLDYNHSLNALYRGEISEADAITTMTGYLDILPMVMEHNLISFDSVIMDLISRLKEQYEYVIIDAPPVGKESETLSLNQVANTVLFVAAYDSSTIPEIQASLEKLDKSGIRILGCIVNRMLSTRNVLTGAVYKNEARKEGEAKGKTKGKKKKKKKGEKSLSTEARETEEMRSTLTSGVKNPFADEKSPSEAEGVATPKLPEESKKKRGLFGRRTEKKPASKAKGKPGEEPSGGKAAKAPASEKPGRKTRSSTRKKRGKTDPFANLKPEKIASVKPKSIFDDLDDLAIGDTGSPSAPTDAEMTEALLRIGLEGSWGEGADKDKPPEDNNRNNIPPPPPVAPPSTRKRKNPFDDL